MTKENLQRSLKGIHFSRSVLGPCDRVAMSLALAWVPTQGTAFPWLLGLVGPQRMHTEARERLAGTARRTCTGPACPEMRPFGPAHPGVCKLIFPSHNPQHSGPSQKLVTACCSLGSCPISGHVAPGQLAEYGTSGCTDSLTHSASFFSSGTFP